MNKKAVKTCKRLADIMSARHPEMERSEHSWLRMTKRSWNASSDKEKATFDRVMTARGKEREVVN